MPHTTPAGQRQHGLVVAALTTAEIRCQNLAEEAQVFRDSGQPLPAYLGAGQIQAFVDLELARARYAATPQGEADLRARMVHLSGLPAGADTRHRRHARTKRWHAYATAIASGRNLRTQT